ANSPSEYSVVSFSTRRLRSTAVNATTPSTERSMLPMRMTNVPPMQSTSGTAAELSNPTRFMIEMKLGLKTLIRTQSAKRTATGAQLRQRVTRETDPDPARLNAASEFKGI